MEQLSEGYWGKEQILNILQHICSRGKKIKNIYWQLLVLVLQVRLGIIPLHRAPKVDLLARK